MKRIIALALALLMVFALFACAKKEESTEKKLGMVDKGEQLLLDLCFHQLRVRIHDTIARIELDPSEFNHIMEESVRLQVHQTLREIGFSYVTLDILGYRTGSMNETLNDKEKVL